MDYFPSFKNTSVIQIEQNNFIMKYFAASVTWCSMLVRMFGKRGKKRDVDK